jgi:pyridoxamine 5'-phosphate oxidase
MTAILTDHVQCVVKRRRVEDAMARRPVIPPSPTEAEHAAMHAGEEVRVEASEPIELFLSWLEQAGRAEPNDPNAMALATVDPDGLPDVRMVLLKDVDERGFVFYTNLESAKGVQLAANPQAALLFHWKSLRRQVRVRGAVSRVTDAEADAYFATRARSSQIGAWASRQSRPLEGPLALEGAVAQYGLKFGLGAIPRPPQWSGLRLEPLAMEFWRSRRSRLHERLVFRRVSTGAPWEQLKLYP